jgi:cell division protein FtsI (penicillin-binding protein 3)
VEKKTIITRAYVLFGVFALLFILVIVRSCQIQTDGRATVFSKKSDKLPERTVQRFPRRGEILDCNRIPLITSVSTYDIYWDATVVKKDSFNVGISELAKKLAFQFGNKNAREYETFLRTARERKNRYVLIQRKVPNDVRQLLRTFPIFRLGQLKGGLIDTDEQIERRRPNGELLKRTLGYVKLDGKKMLHVGIEGAYNTYLEGQIGEEVEQKIASGWKKMGKILKEPVEGADLITTIDKEIQEVAHAELLNQLKHQNAKSGSVILMDVKTGGIRAIANLTRGNDGEYYELFNHAIGTKEVPGSTFKLASVMAALEDERIDIEDKVNAKGIYTYYGSTLKDTEEKGYGQISIRRAFELSSNVISSVIATAYKGQPSMFVDRLKSFGLDKPTGIDLEGEPNPTLYTPGTKNWSGISLPWMAVGYEVQQTPLQTLCFYNAVANNGVMVKPQFIKEVRRGSSVVKTFETIVLNPKICSEKTYKILQSCLKGVMKNGTGSALKSSYFDIAGKTGTARILNDDLRYGEKGEEKYQASFVGYFPADRPIYSCIVVISAPTKDIYGAVVSGTVFASIANKVYATALQYHEAINENTKRDSIVPGSKDGYKSDYISLLKALNIPFKDYAREEWIATTAEGKFVQFDTRKVSTNSVPKVIGLSARDAVYMLENAGLYVKVKGVGTVIAQSIASGNPLIAGQNITLTLK